MQFVSHAYFDKTGYPGQHFVNLYEDLFCIIYHVLVYSGQDTKKCIVPESFGHTLSWLVFLSFGADVIEVS